MAPVEKPDHQKPRRPRRSAVRTADAEEDGATDTRDQHVRLHHGQRRTLRLAPVCHGRTVSTNPTIVPGERTHDALTHSAFLVRAGVLDRLTV